MIKRILKVIWDIRWIIFALFMMISFITSTIQDFISKDYDSGFNNLMIVLLFIEVLLLLWSRAEAEKLIDSQDKIIKQNEKSIELRDEIIDKQSKWINQVTKIAKESTQKDKTSKKPAENLQKNV